MYIKTLRAIGLVSFLFFLIVPIHSEEVAKKPVSVEVVNFPDPQNVTVANFPETQNVSGTVNVGNFPEDEDGNIMVNVQKAKVSPCDLYKFVGVTSAKTNGGAGWKVMNEMCLSEYGDNARMCTTEEIMKTPVGQWSALTSNAWIHPVIIANNEQMWVDYSGYTATYPDEFSCYAWNFFSHSDWGMAIQSDGRLRRITCDNEAAVTCCLPYE